MQDENDAIPSGLSLREEARQTEARQAADAAREESPDVVEQVKQTGEEAVSSAVDWAHDATEAQQYQIGESIEAIAVALQASVDSLRDQGHGEMADYWHVAADGMDDLAKRVKNKPLEQIWVEAEHYVRDQPGLAFGGAVAAGFLLSRFLKSSSSDTAPASPTHQRTPADRESGYSSPSSGV